MEEKLKLYGFNNLTKSLSFNIYDICYAKTSREQQDYLKFIAAQYNRPEVRKIILEQVEYIDPELIIVCNKVEKLLCDLAGVESIASYRDGDDGAMFYKNGNRLIISVGHPAMKNSSKYCNSILDIVYNEL